MTDKVQEHINHILDVNSSWREAYNEIGCLMAFDYDLELEGSILAWCLQEDHNLSEDDAINHIIQFAIDNNYIWDKTTIMDNKEFVIDLLNDNGGEGEVDYEDYVNSH